MAQTKATKKFESRHLKDTLKKRKEHAKIKQRHQVNAKRKAKRAQTIGDAEEDEQPAQKKQKQDNEALQNMSVDDFFAGGFEVPEDQQKKSRSKPSKDRKDNDKKRKRDEAVTEDIPETVDDNKEHGAEDSDDSEADQAGAHMDDLKALAKKDPEFYKYLQENDAELLDFAETAELDEVDELSGSDDEKKDKKKRAKDVDSGKIIKATVQKWTKAMVEQHSLRSMREVVLAFRAAAHLNEDDGKEYKYTISNADVYHEIVVSALKHIPTVLSHHLPVKQLQNGKVRVPTDNKKFRTLAKLLTSHTVSLQHLLSNLSDASTIKLTLTSILDLTPYILSFKKAVKSLINSVVTVWSSTTHDESIRISAFLILRRLSLISDPGLKESLLRSTYQGLIKASRTTTIHNLPGINLMKNTSLELWGLVEPSLAYTTAFAFIRQLAIHLRTCIKNNANDSYKAVYNWQYVHSLDFWSRVLSTHCDSLTEATVGKQSPLRPLIYPLTQVTLGAMRLIPTSAYFPLRFHLVRALLRLSNATGTFIPLAAPLYEVLASAEMKKPPKPSTLKALDFETSIRASKAYLRTRVYQDGVGEQVAELLGDFFTLWCKNIAFPELALPVVVMLRRWLKEVSPWNSSSGGPRQSNGTGANRGRLGGKKGGKSDEGTKGNRNSKVNGQIVLLVQKLEANSRFIEERRAKVEFAPNDRAGVEAFLKEFEASKTPLGAFVEGQRKQREERRKIIEQGRRDDERKRVRDEKKEKDKKVEQDGFDGSDVDESDADAGLEEDDEGESEEEEEDEEEPEMEIDEEDERELDDDEIEVIES